MAILLSLGALALGVLIVFGALATDGAAAFPLVLGALLWMFGLTGFICFAIYGKALHDIPKGKWYRDWLTRRRQRLQQNNHVRTHPPVARA